MSATVRFPRTPHLAWLGEGRPRGDKVLSAVEAERFLSAPVTLEEKVDGANLGIWFSAEGEPVLQNRGTVLAPGAQPQFQAVWMWLARRRAELHAALGLQLVLFGEWCFAVHSVKYTGLPDWFLAFDIYSREARRYWSSDRREEFNRKWGLHGTPILGRGRYSLKDLQSLLAKSSSRFGGAPVEGLYLRQEAGGWLEQRAKLVRAEFVQSIDAHWSARPIQKNALSPAPS